MIYLVTTQTSLINDELWKVISPEDSLDMIKNWDVIQLDSETKGVDPHLMTPLTLQLGNRAADTQIVIDLTTVDPRIYKDKLESTLCVGHNLKFDCQVLFIYGIVLRKVFDTMVIEQLLHLGYDNTFFHYSLHDVALRYLNIDIDKSVRGEIIWRGLDAATIQYAAGDVVHLEDLMDKLIAKCQEQNCTIGMEIENAFVPVISYLEWCGIRLDVQKWQAKMKQDLVDAEMTKQNLEDWLRMQHQQDSFYDRYFDNQLNLFSDELTCTLNWNSATQLIPMFQHLGFNTKVKDKKTGETKDSISEKDIKKQKGINDEFLRLFFGVGEPGDPDYYPGYQGAMKVISTYGQNYLDAINPETGRIHTTFRQLGAASGRMSCGSSKENPDLSRLKHHKATYPQLQNLPHDATTRGAFVPNPGNLMTSCDYSALESRLGADIYNEQSMLDEFNFGSKDMHALCAWMVFRKECEERGCTGVKDVKTLAPDYRSKVKSVEFAKQFGGGPSAIKGSLGCTHKEAVAFSEYYDKGFPGVTKFKALNSRYTKAHGYVLMCKYTGHKMYWEDWNKWIYRQKMDPTEFECLPRHEKDEHQKAAAYWERMSLNAPTQGTGIIILKYAMIMFMKWILANGYFNKVLICDLIHDEAVIEYPAELESIVVPKLKECMEKSAATFCKKLPIPAAPETGDHWIH